LVAALLENCETLQQVRVQGELSNYKVHTSGHHYFTLKDARSQLRCVMFRREAAYLSFRPQDGLQVIAEGRVAVYEPGGQYQLYVRRLTYAGPGALYAAFEALKRRLEAEGLFDPARKRPLPAFPRTVGVITSEAGAALRDICSIIRRRWGSVQILLYPSLVQGAEAVPALIHALEVLNRREEVEVIILGRGGGSIEDLWAFNDEALARAIAASRVPVVSAVGHETDFTIADFVADRRAPTPSAAAEVVVPNREEWLARVRQLETRLEQALTRGVEQARQRVEALAQRRVMTHPEERWEAWVQMVDELAERQQRAEENDSRQRRERVTALAQTLEALNPRNVLERGYSIFLQLPGREVVDTVTKARVGRHGEVLLRDGRVTCWIEGIVPARREDKE